jgi:hypothetical protein
MDKIWISSTELVWVFHERLEAFDDCSREVPIAIVPAPDVMLLSPLRLIRMMFRYPVVEIIFIRGYGVVSEFERHAVDGYPPLQTSFQHLLYCPCQRYLVDSPAALARFEIQRFDFFWWVGWLSRIYFFSINSRLVFHRVRARLVVEPASLVRRRDRQPRL